MSVLNQTYFGDLFRISGTSLEQFRLLINIGRVDPVQLILRLFACDKFAQRRQPFVLFKGIAVGRCSRRQFHVRSGSGRFGAQQRLSVYVTSSESLNKRLKIMIIQKGKTNFRSSNRFHSLNVFTSIYSKKQLKLKAFYTQHKSQFTI